MLRLRAVAQRNEHVCKIRLRRLFFDEAASLLVFLGVNGALDFGPLAGDQPGGEGTGKVSCCSPCTPASFTRFVSTLIFRKTTTHAPPRSAQSQALGVDDTSEFGILFAVPVIIGVLFSQWQANQCCCLPRPRVPS